MRKLILFLFLICCFPGIRSQNDLQEDEQELRQEQEQVQEQEQEQIQDTIRMNSTRYAYRRVSDSQVSDSQVSVPDAWDVNLDKLMRSLHVKHYFREANREGYGKHEWVNDSVYVNRLAQLPCIIQLPYNDVIRSCIDLYVDRRRNLVEYMLGAQAFYFPIIEQTLDSYGLPLELKYLAIVESALNPVALSRAGASGLWQFMLPTGKFYGLEINSLVDERRDPIKSTDAACRYFKDLYDIYQDWNLVIAAYNCGPGNVNKAIKRAGGKTDYWELYPYLPRETRSYLPFFVAANYVMNYFSYHNLYPVETDLSLSTDTVMVNDQLHFDQIAEILKISKEDIRSLNPQYKEDIIPGKSKPRPLRLPGMSVYAFIEKYDAIVNYRSEQFFADLSNVGYQADTRVKQTHRVRSGENLTTIGNKYGVTAADIRKWNGLKSNRVAVGKNITIYVDNGGYGLAATNNSSTQKRSESSYKKESSASTASTSSATSRTSKSAPQYVKYKVRNGDNYYTLAKKYPGYSHDDLMKLNNTKTAKLQVGQVIRVPKI